MYPRDLAAAVLAKVLVQKQVLDEALRDAEPELKDPSMRGWLHEVCSGTLRWKGRIDQIIDAAALKKKPSGWLRRVLSIGVYQLIAQERINAKAVVFETVEVIKKKDGRAPSNFANALLRKVAEQASRWRNLPFSETGAYLWASMPDWFWKKIRDQHGLEWAKAFALASLDRPNIWIRCKDGFKPEWGSREEAPSNVSDAYFVKNSPPGPVFSWPGFEDGRFIVQDISSQLLVSGVTSEVQALEKNASSVLDLCAAPGGKSVGLAWNGFDVTATDKPNASPSDDRFKLLRRTVERVATQVKVVQRSELLKEAAYDVVWVDSPCTGSGIIRRHPDVKWLKNEDDLKQLVKLQEELISAAFEFVRPQGFLVYSVCSVFKEEGIEQVDRAALKFGLKPLKTWNFAPNEAPFGDGFFGCLLQKK